MYDVTIIGGGVVGTAVAWALARYDLRVVVVEAGPDVALGATKANSAIVHGGYAESHDTLKGRLCYQGRRRFAGLEGQLHFGYRKTGSLVLAYEDDGLPELQRLLANGRANGLADIRIIHRDEIVALEPKINPAVRHALYCEGAGVCSPFGLAIAFMEVAMQNSAELLLNTRVAGIRRDENGLLQIHTLGGGEVCGGTRYVVNAAGAGADGIARLLGDESFTLHPRSGEYAVLQQGAGETLLQRVLFGLPTAGGKGILAAPTVFGNVIAGPDAIDGGEYGRNTHPDRLYAVLQGARQHIPALDAHRFIRGYAGVRAVADTNDFILRPSETEPRVIHAAGIQSPGITASPAIAEHVVGLLQREGLDLVPRRGYRANRPALARKPARVEHETLQALLALPQGDKNRMLCRCEQVPETMIREAARGSIPLTTPDAVKRRTTAGMGWCQGTFCRPRVTALLEELNPGRVDGRTDVERDGLRRVSREEFVAYAERQKRKDQPK